MSDDISTILDDLVAEYDRIEAILDALTDDQWQHPSAAVGWTVADVVLHLAQSEEYVAQTIAAGAATPDRAPPGTAAMAAVPAATSVDEAMARLVEAERATPTATFARWRTARRAAVAALARADPTTAVRWAATPLRPRTLATTRLAEHWAHALDITGPLGIGYPDTARLRHIAWLGHRTLPYGFARHNEPAHEIYCDLVGPSGERWAFGHPDSASTISGSAGAFCRVGAQRLAPDESGLTTTGPHGAGALRVLRNYAA